MKKRSKIPTLALIVSLVLTACTLIEAKSEEKADLRISVEQVKKMLGDSNVVIIDLRDPVSWSKSDMKIPGAVRENPENFSGWAHKYPKDKTIIFYCA